MGRIAIQDNERWFLVEFRCDRDGVQILCQALFTCGVNNTTRANTFAATQEDQWVVGDITRENNFNRFHSSINQKH